MKPASALQSLCDRLKRCDRLNATLNILFWDEQVNLPSGSAELRCEQTALLSEIVHREATAPEVGEWLDALEAKRDALSADEQVIVREAKRDYDRLVKLPPEFVSRRAAARSHSFHAWVEARKKDSFSDFQSHLQRMLDLAQEEAAHQDAENPYDYWIDASDPGMTSARIDPLFKELREGLQPILETILANSTKPDDLFHGFPEDRQETFLREVAEAFGFDTTRGRIDRAIHPFCGGHPQDTRMTTRYDSDNPLDSITSAMHETGHALYEQGLPNIFPGSGLSQAVGMAVHESQSRIWENQVGRSRAFWTHWEPRYRELFSEQLNEVDSDRLYRAINQVAVTPIRVDADEITYNLHIMLRYTLERDLFAGRLTVADIPEAWNTLSKELLGFAPKSDRVGCLQDVHWSEGLFGYFPSYTLGNILAAQLWSCVQEAQPNLEDALAKGDYTPLLGWLREHIHSQGRRYDTGELVCKVVGGPLDAKPLLRYLRERYLPLYTS